jgi:predicted phosphate transport protein (TIGR00153 family)
MKFLLPKEPAFHENFKEMSVCMSEITGLFKDFVVRFDDFEAHWLRAKDIEHRADAVTHRIINLLNQSFITPFDREDIYQLVSDFDDIIDLVENTFNNIYLYEVPGKMSFLDEFAVLIDKATRALSALIEETFKHQKYTESIRKLIYEIHDLEDEGDLVYHRELRRLFKEEKDPFAVMKWKDILGTLERIMDVCQKTSNTIEAIVVKGG